MLHFELAPVEIEGANFRFIVTMELNPKSSEQSSVVRVKMGVEESMIIWVGEGFLPNPYPESEKSWTIEHARLLEILNAENPLDFATRRSLFEEALGLLDTTIEQILKELISKLSWICRVPAERAFAAAFPPVQ